MCASWFITKVMLLNH